MSVYTERAKLLSLKVSDDWFQADINENLPWFTKAFGGDPANVDHRLTFAEMTLFVFLMREKGWFTDKTEEFAVSGAEWELHNRKLSFACMKHVDLWQPEVDRIDQVPSFNVEFFGQRFVVLDRFVGKEQAWLLKYGQPIESGKLITDLFAEREIPLKGDFFSNQRIRQASAFEEKIAKFVRSEIRAIQRLPYRGARFVYQTKEKLSERPADDDKAVEQKPVDLVKFEEKLRDMPKLGLSKKNPIYFDKGLGRLTEKPKED